MQTEDNFKFYDSEQVKCPYCGKEDEINHEDGYGYEEEVIHTQECSHCGKTYRYLTTINFYYDVDKCDCLNEGGHHNWFPQTVYPKSCTRMECSICGETRKPTEEEIKKYKLYDN